MTIAILLGLLLGLLMALAIEDRQRRRWVSARLDEMREPAEDFSKHRDYDKELIEMVRKSAPT